MCLHKTFLCYSWRKVPPTREERLKNTLGKCTILQFAQKTCAPNDFHPQRILFLFRPFYQNQSQKWMLQAYLDLDLEALLISLFLWTKSSFLCFAVASLECFACSYTFTGTNQTYECVTDPESANGLNVHPCADSCYIHRQWDNSESSFHESPISLVSVPGVDSPNPRKGTDTPEKTACQNDFLVEWPFFVEYRKRGLKPNVGLLVQILMWCQSDIPRFWFHINVLSPVGNRTQNLVCPAWIDPNGFCKSCMLWFVFFFLSGLRGSGAVRSFARGCKPFDPADWSGEPNGRECCRDETAFNRRTCFLYCNTDRCNTGTGDPDVSQDNDFSDDKNNDNGNNNRPESNNNDDDERQRTDNEDDRRRYYGGGSVSQHRAVPMFALISLVCMSSGF